MSSPAANPYLEIVRDVTEEMTRAPDLGQVLTAIVTGLVQQAGMNQAILYLYITDQECDRCRTLSPNASSERALHRTALGGRAMIDADPRAHRVPLGQVLSGRAAAWRRRIVVNDFPGMFRQYLADRNSVPELAGDGGEDPDFLERLAGMPFQASAFFPLLVRDELVGVLGCWIDRQFDPEEVEHLAIFARQAATAIKTAELFQQVEHLNQVLANENAYLRAEVREETGFGAVIGDSPAMVRTLRAARQVATTDSTVLLQGETGTGKEVIARAIHDLSNRRDRPLIKVNCGAIAGGLAESEIFGHERGAFTGAVQRRIGRFELADGGTLFMDEVGELPLDLQVKLLRVLQEREFERLGGHQVIRVNVRLIAATNRTLAEEVKAGRFRADLYYRLNVFPIHVPPLRDRRSDIRRLAEHFLNQLGRQLGKPIRGFTESCLRQLEAYDWPGNVRELHNVVERLCVLSPGPLLDLTEPLGPPNASLGRNGLEPLRNVERDHIQKVLEATSWRVEGPRGAAAALGLAPSTLRARMARLGVARPKVS
jgi:formate hydrogenlyase transcriptional activator